MRRLIVISSLASIFLLSTILVYGKASNSAPDLRYYRAKAADPLPARVMDFLQNRSSDGTAEVWVFFTDKGFTDAATFQRAQAAYSHMFTERAMKRREKSGITEIRLSDLPVSGNYVRILKSVGANIHRTSRWLNAAAITVNIDKLSWIAAQTFVQEIEPVAHYKRIEPSLNKGAQQPPSEGEALGSNSLSYGSSFGQLQQINVPICHDSGYAGQGMMIAMFDTGFRTSHSAFSTIISEGRLIAKYDFVFGDTIVDNEAADVSSAWSHGTSTWSATGGEAPGSMYGPAYEASFVLCKTEDVRSETQVEEYNWVAALEFSDSLGVDIVSSSLSYSDWYTSSDYDGNTCVTTVAADMAAQNGMLIVNSAGNSGPSPSTLGAPADADSIMTIGAVNSSGTIASFSSRGPTADGRIKPEVCAQGVSDVLASSSGDFSFTTGSGTSFSCPLTAGAAAIVWGANPSWTNMQVREALMQTANNAATPNNTYGWGIIDAWAALHYSFAPPFIPGDADGNGTISVGDAVYIINYIFAGGAPIVPSAAGDADCSGDISVADAVYIINFIFGGGPAPTTCP